MKQHIRIRMSEQTKRMRDPDTADDQISALNQFMHVVTHSYSHDTLTFKPFPMKEQKSPDTQLFVFPRTL